jgi:excisionase family DNA binding protein
MEEPMLTTEQVAEILGVDPRLVREEIRLRRLRAIRIRQKYRITRTDLEVYMRARETMPSQDEEERELDLVG